MAKFTPKFWKPGSEAPGSHLKEERTSPSEGSGSVTVFNSNASMSIEQQRQRLPVFKYRNHILYLMENNRTVIIVGETGSGKSTQLPQYLLESGWAENGRVIAITQPRKVAAITVATRVAEERGSILGDEVGYAVRFDDCSNPQATRIKFVTDGLLIREMMSDPLLSKYSVVILDEAHERSLNTDIIVGLLKKILKRRTDLRVVVASATLDAEQFRDFFNDNDTGDPAEDTAAVLTVEGRMFPVEIYHSLDPIPDYLKGTVETVMNIHKQEKPGDILAFLTGQDEVQNVVSLLIDEARKLPKQAMKMRVLPMHGSLPSAEQMKVFETRTSSHVRKIVIATNIAEASITINGIVYVVDCGFVKLRAFNPSCGTEMLVIVPVSQASAEQRAGRAGRVRSGKAYRLYTEGAFCNLRQCTVPEIQRSSMASVVLQLKALGIDNILRFPFLSAPPAQNLLQGVELLFALGAIDDKCQLTLPLGHRMAEFPLDPMFAAMLLSSEQFGCSEEAVTIAAVMQIENVFVVPSNQKQNAERAKRKFSAAEGDLISMLNVYNAFVEHKRNSRWCHNNFLHYKGLCRASEIRDQLCRLLKRSKVRMVSCGQDVESLLKCIVQGFFANAARYHPSGVYKTVRDEFPLHIHPTSVLYVEKPPAWVVFNEIVHTKKEFMRDVTVVKAEWLYELAPHYYQFGTERERAAKRPRFV